MLQQFKQLSVSTVAAVMFEIMGDVSVIGCYEELKEISSILYCNAAIMSNFILIMAQMCYVKGFRRGSALPLSCVDHFSIFLLVVCQQL